MAHGKEVLDGLRAGTRVLREHIPDVYKAYGSLNSAAFTEGALDAKTKELIALAIAVSKECDGCIASHARRAAREGATSDEVAEALGVAILMNGGPGTVYAPRAFEAYQEFSG
jgi:AhpD family alkylhydroperoxidase